MIISGALNWLVNYDTIFTEIMGVFLMECCIVGHMENYILNQRDAGPTGVAPDTIAPRCPG